MAQVALSLVGPTGSELPLASSAWDAGAYRVLEGTAGLGLSPSMAAFTDSPGDGRRVGSVRTAGRLVTLALGVYADLGERRWVQGPAGPTVSQNHANNPHGAGTLDWIGPGAIAHTLTSIPTGAPDGGSFVRTTAEAYTNGNPFTTALAYGVKPLTTYHVSMYVRSPSALAVHLNAVPKGAGDSYDGGETNGAGVVLVPNEWARIDTTVLTRPATLSIDARARLQYAANGDAFVLDTTMVLVEESAVLGPYYDGDTAAEPVPSTLVERTVGSLAYRWAGTRGASASVKFRQPWVRTGYASPDEQRAQVQERLDVLTDHLSYVDGKPLPRLRARFQDGSARELEFVHIGGGTEGLTSHGEGFAPLVLTLDCPDSYWVATDYTSFAVSAPGTSEGFLESLPNVLLQPTDAFGEVTVVNPGKVPSTVDWELQGPFTRVEALQGDEGWAFEEAILLGETIHVRKTPAGIEVIDATGASRFTAISDVPRFFQLSPGTSSLTVSATGTSAATKIIGRYRPRYRQVF